MTDLSYQQTEDAITKSDLRAVLGLLNHQILPVLRQLGYSIPEDYTIDVEQVTFPKDKIEIDKFFINSPSYTLDPEYIKTTYGTKLTVAERQPVGEPSRTDTDPQPPANNVSNTRNLTNISNPDVTEQRSPSAAEATPSVASATLSHRSPSVVHSEPSRTAEATPPNPKLKAKLKKTQAKLKKAKRTLKRHRSPSAAKAEDDPETDPKPVPSYNNILSAQDYEALQKTAWANRTLDQDKYTPGLSKPIYKKVYNAAMRTLHEGFGMDASATLGDLNYTDVKFQTLSKLRHDAAKFFGYKHLAFSRQAQKLAKTYLGDQKTFKKKFKILYKYRFKRQFQAELGAVDLAGQSAKQWLEFQDNKADYPNLRYDAVNDGRTRPEHRAWDGIVLPIDHAFWIGRFPPNGWNCRCIITQTDEKVTHLNRDGKDTDPDNPPPFKDADKPFNHNPALSGKVFNGSRYFRKAEARKDFAEQQTQIRLAIRDVHKAEIKVPSKTIRTNIASRSIKISNSIKKHVVKHNNHTMPNSLRDDLMFDLDNVLKNLTLKPEYAVVENRKPKHHKDVKHFIYYNFKYLDTDLFLIVKAWNRKGMKDSLYVILDHEPEINEQ